MSTARKSAVRPRRRRRNPDRAIRFAAVLAVLGVAVVAAVVSYRHAYEVVHAHGEVGLTARLVPLTIDGLIAASGMVLLHAARYQLPVPRLANVGLWLGIAATLAANVAHGLPYGPVGALVAAWPAVALVVAYEILMLLLRAAREVAVESGAEPECPWPHHIPDSAEEAVRFRHEAALDGWVEPRSQRQLADRFGVPRPKVREIVAEVAREHAAQRDAESLEEQSPNGHVNQPEPLIVQPSLDGQGPARRGA